MPRVSLQDVADALGVSKQTVSRALRGERYVKPELRDRVRETAERLGYRSDARFKVLNLVRQGNDARGGETMAFLLPDSTQKQASLYYYSQQVMEGAAKRARESGFGFEVHSLVEQPNRDRVEQMLRARGIELLIIGSILHGDRSRLRLHWERYATVLTGPGIWRPRFHRVVQNHYLNLICILRQLRKLGYKRPALVVQRTVLRRAINVLEAAFCQNAGIVGLRNPEKFIWRQLLYVDLPGCREWLRKMQVDVVIGENQNEKRFLEMGFSIPEEIGYVSLVAHPKEPRVSGINMRSDLLGAHAVDLLAGHYYRNERGVPESAKIVLHEGEWVPGETVRKQ